MSSRGPTCCTTRQRPEDIELLRKLTRPGHKPDHGPRNDLTGILVCRRSASFIDAFGRHPAIITRPSPPGLAALQTVRGEPRFSNPRKDTATEPLRKLTERLQDAHPSASGHSPEPPGSTEHLRVFTEHLRVFTNASGRSPADHPTRPGLSRPTGPFGVHCTTCG